MARFNLTTGLVHAIGRDAGLSVQQSAFEAVRVDRRHRVVEVPQCPNYTRGEATDIDAMDAHRGAVIRAMASEVRWHTPDPASAGEGVVRAAQADERLRASYPGTVTDMRATDRAWLDSAMATTPAGVHQGYALHALAPSSHGSLRDLGDGVDPEIRARIDAWGDTWRARVQNMTQDERAECGAQLQALLREADADKMPRPDDGDGGGEGEGEKSDGGEGEDGDGEGKEGRNSGEGEAGEAPCVVDGNSMRNADNPNGDPNPGGCGGPVGALGRVAQPSLSPSEYAPPGNATVRQYAECATAVGQGVATAARRALQARAQCTIDRPLEVGPMIDETQLCEIATGLADKPFARFVPGEKVDTAVWLCVDGSGSMSSPAMWATACGFAAGLAHGMQSIPGVASQIVTNHNASAQLRGGAIGPGIHVLHGWNQRIRNPVTDATDMACRCAPQAGTEYWGAVTRAGCVDLARRPESRKIIVLVTDGRLTGCDRPAAGNDLRLAQDEAVRNGIEVHGIAWGPHADWRGTLDSSLEVPEITDTGEIAKYVLRLLVTAKNQHRRR